MGQAMYGQGEAGGAAPGAEAGGAQEGGAAGGSKPDDVIDAEFTDDKK